MLQEVDESQDNEILNLSPKELLELLSTFNKQGGELHNEQIKEQEKITFIKQYLKTVLIQKLIRLNVIERGQELQFKSLTLKDVIDKIKTQNNKPTTLLRRKESIQGKAIMPKVKKGIEKIKLHLKKDLKEEDLKEDINSLLKDLADELNNEHHKATDIDRLLLNKDEDKKQILEVLEKIEKEMIYEEEEKIILLRQIAESLGLKGEEAKEFIDNGMEISLEMVSSIKETLEACGLHSVIPQIQDAENIQRTFQGSLSQEEIDRRRNEEGVGMGF